MKKNLLLSSALVAAGLFVAGDAFAQAKPITLSVGGYWHLYYNFTSQDNANATATSLAEGGANRARDGAYNDGEIFFRGSTTLDNGLQVGFQAEFEMDNQQDQVDEIFMDFRGSFGRVILGQFDSAAREMQRVAPSGSRSYLNGANEMSWTTNPYTGLPVFTGTSTANVLDFEKIVYFSPVFSGFQLGLSYGPNGAESAVAAGAANTGGLINNWIPLNNAGAGDVWDAAVTYTGKFGDIGVAAGLGYQWQDNQQTGATAQDPTQSYLGHLIFTVGPFNFGGTFAVHERDFLTPVAGQRNSTTSTFYDLGVSYTTGPWIIGATWYYGDMEARLPGGVLAVAANGANNPDMEINRYLLNASYLLGPGISIETGLAFEKFEFGGGSTQPDMNGTTFFVGTRLGF